MFVSASRVDKIVSREWKKWREEVDRAANGRLPDVSHAGHVVNKQGSGWGEVQANAGRA